MDKDVMSRAEAAFVLMKMMRRGGGDSPRGRGAAGWRPLSGQASLRLHEESCASK